MVPDPVQRRPAITPGVGGAWPRVRRRRVLREVVGGGQGKELAGAVLGVVGSTAE
jgi:hypothetical protein